MALWNSRDGKFGRDYSVSLLHSKLEFIFNHYGLNLEFHDLYNGVPKDNLGEDYIGIVSWLTTQVMETPDEYSVWLRTQVRNKKKLLVMGDFGFSRKKSEKEEKIARVNQVMNLIGIDASESFYDNPLLIRIKSKKDSLSEFERSLANELPYYRVVRNKDPKNTVWLSVSSGNPETESDVIIVGPKGGYVQEGFSLFHHPQEGKTYWRVDPFALVKTIFSPKLVPIPETTTINGKRIYFSHIDGDGFMNVSNIDRKRFSSEVIRDEIIMKYPLPITASVITMEVNPEWQIKGAEKFSEIAKDIFKLPNVEPASHTFSHPLSWNKSPSALEVRNYLGENSNHKGPILSYYKAGKVLDYERETVGSLNFINEKILDEKKAELLLWSGSCRPPGEAILELEKKGYLNMNGGDSRMDQKFKSVSHLSSLYRRPEGRLQVYSGAPNENIYTDLWSPPYSGFDQVIETFENTESPRRLKPVNVYYHFYSGEFRSSLQSLTKVYDWVLKQDLHPVRASFYPKMVENFLNLKLEEISKTTFRVSNARSIKTLRFESEELFPDYEKSKNVLGHQRLNSSLYVFLGPQSEALIELKAQPSSGLFLESSNGKIESIVRTGKRITYTFRGEVPLEATFNVYGEKKKFHSKKKFATVTLEEK